MARGRSETMARGRSETIAGRILSILARWGGVMDIPDIAVGHVMHRDDMPKLLSRACEQLTKKPLRVGMTTPNLLNQARGCNRPITRNLALIGHSP